MLFAQALRAAMFGVFRYSGRSDRLEHWTFAFLSAALIVGAYAFIAAGVRLEGVFLLTLLLTILWMILAHIALFVRRLHDANRSGLYMLLPAGAASVLLAGWLAEIGYADYQPDYLADYSWFVFQIGRVGCGISVSFLIWIFLNEGDEGENRYGMAP